MNVYITVKFDTGLRVQNGLRFVGVLFEGEKCLIMRCFMDKYNKVEKVIGSCKNKRQLDVAKRYCQLFTRDAPCATSRYHRLRFTSLLIMRQLGKINRVSKYWYC